MSPVGDWYLRPDPLNPDRQVWSYDKGAPSADPTATSMFPSVERPAKMPAVEHDGPEHPGGDWANADAYASYDEVDSLTIVDEGAPA